MLAVDILIKKTQDYNILNDAGNYALHQNRDVWHLLDKEDRMRLEAGLGIAGPEEKAEEENIMELTKQLVDKYDCRHDKC